MIQAALSTLFGLCVFSLAVVDMTLATTVIQADDVKVYIIEIATTDTYRLPASRSNVAFRLTLFGRKGEIGHFVPGGTDHQALQKMDLPHKDIGNIYEVAIYTTMMHDPWHVRTVSVREGESGRVFCFVFDKWIGWNNTLIWSSCIDDDCGCHWPDKENYMILVAGPLAVETEIHLFGTFDEATDSMEASKIGDAWEGWRLTNVGDIQKIGIHCHKPESGPFHLKRIYVGKANEWIWRCFKFNTQFCNPADKSTHYIEKSCQNVDCSCM